MQILFSKDMDDTLTPATAKDRFRNSVQNTFSLYLISLFVLINIAEQAKEDARRRKSKFVPTPEDLKFTPVLYDNPITQSLATHKGLKGLFNYHNLKEKIEEDLGQKLYKSISKDEEYSKYILKVNKTDQDHIDILLFFFKAFVKDEYFNELMEDLYNTWEDDKTLVLGSIKKTIKALPAEADFYDEYRADGDETKVFGNELMDFLLQNDEELENIINPMLKNWDSDRVASLDMIMLKMSVAEFLHFPTIPTKASINEYVEISKLYSTDKSKEFINGILDQIMKKLVSNGDIIKVGRGLLEE